EIPLVSGSTAGHKRHLRRGGGKRLRAEAEFDERFDEYALRAADGTDGDQAAFANPVVDGATRHVQQGGRLFDGNAAAKPRFESRHCTVHECPFSFSLWCACGNGTSGARLMSCVTQRSNVLRENRLDRTRGYGARWRR